MATKPVRSTADVPGLTDALDALRRDDYLTGLRFIAPDGGAVSDGDASRPLYLSNAGTGVAVIARSASGVGTITVTSPDSDVVLSTNNSVWASSITFAKTSSADVTFYVKALKNRDATRSVSLTVTTPYRVFYVDFATASQIPAEVLTSVGGAGTAAITGGKLVCSSMGAAAKAAIWLYATPFTTSSYKRIETKVKSSIASEHYAIGLAAPTTVGGISTTWAENQRTFLATFTSAGLELKYKKGSSLYYYNYSTQVFEVATPGANHRITYDANTEFTIALDMTPDGLLCNVTSNTGANVTTPRVAWSSLTTFASMYAFGGDPFTDYGTAAPSYFYIGVR